MEKFFEHGGIGRSGEFRDFGDEQPESIEIDISVPSQGSAIKPKKADQPEDKS